MKNQSFYTKLSEQEARMLLAPLAAAAVLSSDSKDEMKIVEGEPYDSTKIVRQYESCIDIFYNAFRVIHNID